MSLSRSERRKLARRRWAELVASSEETKPVGFGGRGVGELERAWSHRPAGDGTIASYVRGEWSDYRHRLSVVLAIVTGLRSLCGATS